MQRQWMKISIFLLFLLIITKKYYIDTDISLYNVKNEKIASKNYKTWMISYASHGVHIQNQNNLILSSRIYNVSDAIIPYQLKHIPYEYREIYKDILSQKRGAGYWLWKPYIILDALNKMSENDVLIYADASGAFGENFNDLIKLVETHDFIVFPNSHNNSGYMKKVVIDKIMQGDDALLNKKQLNAALIIMRNTLEVRKTIELWLKYCQDEELLTDIKMSNEYSDLIDHRHDQSILTALYYKFPDKFYLHNSSFKFQKAFETYRRRKPNVSMLPLTYNSFWGIYTLIYINLIDKYLK